MLIMGGLIVVGILALIGAFFLLREGKGEKSSQASTKQSPQSNQPTVVQAVEDAQQAIPTLQGPAQQPQSNAQGGAETVQLAFPGEAAVQSQADGQVVAELAKQVHALQQQTIEVEQRLRRLSKLLEIREQNDQTMVGIPALQRHRPNS